MSSVKAALRQEIETLQAEKIASLGAQVKSLQEQILDLKDQVVALTDQTKSLGQVNKTLVEHSRDLGRVIGRLLNEARDEDSSQDT